jgi:hypothetical protein
MKQLDVAAPRWKKRFPNSRFQVPDCESIRYWNRESGIWNRVIARQRRAHGEEWIAGQT